MKGLVIKEPWISHILEGRKTWEMRSTNSKTKECIALIKAGSGMILGVAEMVNSFGPLTEDELESSFEHHQIPKEFRTPFSAFKWRYAWELQNIKVFEQPLPYVHRAGAVIFTTLDDHVAQQVRDLADASSNSKIKLSSFAQRQPTIAESTQHIKPGPAGGIAVQNDAKKKMNDSSRKRVLELAKKAGFMPELKSDGSDHFTKVIVLKAPSFPVKLYVDKVIGMDNAGEPVYFKVCLHPDHYQESAECLDDVNAATKKGENLFRHSAFTDCPYPPGPGERNAKCYKVESWKGLENLYSGLIAERAQIVKARIEARHELAK